MCTFMSQLDYPGMTPLGLSADGPIPSRRQAIGGGSPHDRAGESAEVSGWCSIANGLGVGKALIVLPPLAGALSSASPARLQVLTLGPAPCPDGPIV